MAGDTVVEITSGPSGTGKSYSRVGCFIVKEWIPDFEGTLFTNVNLGRVPEDHSHPPKAWIDDFGRRRKNETFIRRICNFAAKKHGGKPSDYARRVKRIPPSAYNAWRDGRSGPWDFFKGVDVDGSHIQIDEIHVFCPASGAAKRTQQWQDWLGEIRHEGATIEFMTQHLQKLNKKLFNEAAVRRTLHSWGSMRDPFFRIAIFDWYELIAAFVTGKYRVPTVVTERVRKDEGFTINHREVFKLDPFYFRFFNSFQQSNHGGKKGTRRKRQFEKRSKLGLLGWFFRKHWSPITSRAFIAAGAVWLCFYGGITLLLGLFMSFMAATASANTVKPPAVEPVAQVVEHEELLEEVVIPAAALPYVPAQPIQPIATAATPPPATSRELELQDELDRAIAEAEELAAEAERIEAQRERLAAVVLVTPDEVTFREGYSYRVGDEIDYGIYAGHVVTAINYKRRAVILDDEIILRMGRNNGTVSDTDRVPATTDPD